MRGARAAGVGSCGRSEAPLEWKIIQVDILAFRRVSCLVRCLAIGNDINFPSF